MDRKVIIYLHNVPAAEFRQTSSGYELQYFPEYKGPPISQTLPRQKERYLFSDFPPFFDGLLPEGIMLEVLLKKHKLDANDYFGQIKVVGRDLVGAVTVQESAE